jgi:hypothetical protein
MFDKLGGGWLLLALSSGQFADSRGRGQVVFFGRLWLIRPAPKGVQREQGHGRVNFVIPASRFAAAFKPRLNKGLRPSALLRAARAWSRGRVPRRSIVKCEGFWAKNDLRASAEVINIQVCI